MTRPCDNTLSLCAAAITLLTATSDAHADLKIAPYHPGNGPQPQSGFCDTAQGKSVIRFRVRNTGAKDVLNTRVHVTWGGAGSVVRGITPEGAGKAVHVRIPVPDNVPVTSQLSFTVTADHLKQAFEISETNNARQGACIVQGQPGGNGGS